MLIAANWKMNLGKSEIDQFSNFLQSNEFHDRLDVCIFPPSVYINYLNTRIENLPISIGAQNCYHEFTGPFTGEVSPTSLKDIGCKYVLVGHSERRINNNESNLYVQKCTSAAIKSNLIPIICVGETLKDRESGIALDFIEKQLIESIPSSFENIFVAYEPIWSIGTGKIPSSSEIKEMHKHIKQVISSKFNNSIKVIYGGSVNPSNVSDILNVNEVDGVLIGGASLNPKDFLAIYHSTVKHLNLSFSNN